jgi:hypothetical protein
VADRVFGQGGSFTTSTCNSGGISASSLCTPDAATVDGAGHSTSPTTTTIACWSTTAR